MSLTVTDVPEDLRLERYAVLDDKLDSLILVVLLINWSLMR